MDRASERRSAYLAVFAVLLALAALLVVADAADAQRTATPRVISPGGLSPSSPAMNETIHNNTPLVVVSLDPGQGPYRTDSVVFLFNNRPVHTLEDDFRVADERIEYQVSTLFRLQPGQQNVTVRIETESGELHELRYAFHYSTTPPSRGDAGAVFEIVLVTVATLVGLAVLGLAGWIVYLTQVKGWSWRKFQVRFRIPREVLTLYVPIGLAVVGALVALFMRDTFGLTFRFHVEYILLAALVLGSFPYALDVHYKRLRRRAYERSYAQFLFEMADAMRGGIDPMKAVLELSKTETGLLREPLRAAADGIRIGRPFETVMENMVRPMKSPLVARYAMLVGAAAKVGGDISNVIYRAAKDMDDMVKIEGERIRAMKTPIMTIYIAFGVLLMMVNTLMDFGPQLAELDIRSLTGGQLARGEVAAAGAPALERLSMAQMETRFFHLLMITSIGSGLLIGAFTDGKVRYGLVHMLVMVGIGAAFYPLFVL